MKDRFFDLLEKKLVEKTVCVAVSGGADSLALLYLMNEFGKKFDIKIIATTVNHNLREEGKTEAQFVHEICTFLGIYHEILNWEHADIKSDLENKARSARYQLIKEFAQKNDCKIIMTAHHKDDQIETFLMNLARGSGVYGLSGIKEISDIGDFILLRPMLSFSKLEILDFCKNAKIKFFEDSMNEDENFTRVKIRKNRHVLRDKLGIDDDKIILAVNNLARVREMIERKVEDHLQNSQTQKNVFNMERFFKEEDEIILRSLSCIITKISNSDFPPTFEKLQNLHEAIKKGDLPKTLQNVKISAKSHNLVFEKF